jgi:putative transposase
VVLPVSYGG